MGRRRDKMSPVGHEILVVLINAWSKKKKDMHAILFFWLLVTPEEKQKVSSLLSCWLSLVAWTSQTKQTISNLIAREEKKTWEPSVTRSRWKKKLLIAPHTWSVTLEIGPEQMKPTLEWQSQPRSQEDLLHALCLWLSQRLQWVKKKKWILFEWVIWTSSEYSDSRSPIIVAYRSTTAAMKYPDRLNPCLAAHANANPVASS